MGPEDKHNRKVKEKQWENPVNPALTSDDRDKEQLLRLYNEAKRRKDNLTTEAPENGDQKD